MEVYKFGGASIKSATSIRKLTGILKNSKCRRVIVFSAMGKMTNKFEELFELYYSGQDTSLILEEIFAFHDNIAAELFNSASLFHLSFYLKLKDLIRKHLLKKPKGELDYEYDQLVTYGELLSTSIISVFLNSAGIINKLIDAREIIITDNQYRDANINFSLSQLKCLSCFDFNDTEVYVTQGFIGSDSNKNSTSLGREGSDYTAALLAYFLDAKSVTVWKDVDGIYNSDPHIFASCKKINEMSFQEAIELAYFGAKILHPKTIKPLHNKDIPLRVRSFLNPKRRGTLISSHQGIKLKIPVYIFKEDQILLSISPKDFSFIAEANLSIIFSVFAVNNVKINLSENSAISFTVCVDYDKRRIENIITDLSKDYKVLFNSGVTLLTIRNYTSPSIKSLLSGKKIFVEQKTRNTARYIYKSMS